MRRLHYYILCICLALLSFLHVRAERIDTLLHFNLTDLQIDTVKAPDGQTYTKLSYQGCGKGDQLGVPALPIKYVRIKLPYNACNISIDAQPDNQSVIAIEHNVYPVQAPMTGNMNADKYTFVSGAKSIYNANEEYPSICWKLAENSSIREEERHIVIAIYPIVYIPLQKKLTLMEEINLSVSFNMTPSLKGGLTRAVNTVDVGLPYYEYTVITSRALKDSFERLIAWKRQKGINAGVVCVEDITDNLLIDGDTYSHRLGFPNVFLTDDAAKIRQYLRYSYEAGIAKYVLMGGCAEVVPIRYAAGDNNPTEDEDLHIPTDHYFAELYSNWNKDNDIYLGEPSDDLNYGYQISVGRLLCSTAEDIENYTDKLLLYEINPGKGDSNYLRSALYQVSENWMQSPTSTQLSFNRGEYVAERALNSFPDTTIINEYKPLSPPYIYPTGNEVISKMNQRHYGYVTWMGHGSPYRVFVGNININNSSDDWKHWVISSIQDVSQPDESSTDSFAVENMNGLDKLANKDYPMIVFSHGCINAPFDKYIDFTEYPNMAQSFTQGKDYGGPAFIGHTRKSDIDASYLIQDAFNNNLRRNGIGESLHRGKLEYGGDFMHKAIINTNLIGCPEMDVWTDTLQSLNATIEYEDDEGYVTLDEIASDTIYIGQRYITVDGVEKDSTSYRVIPYHESEQVFYPSFNCLLSLTGRNYRPSIMPLYLQNATLSGKRYLIVKDVTCTSEVMENTTADEGGVSFEAGADYTFETNGTFRMTKNVVIERGAKLLIKPSDIKY